MSKSIKYLLASLAVCLPAAAFAGSTDAAYCKALAKKYQQYLDMSSKKGEQPQSLDAKVALADCQAGNPAGIPGLETALQHAKLALPSRDEPVAAPAAAKQANCGVETWSTEKMAYIGVPCPQDGTGDGSTGASR